MVEVVPNRDRLDVLFRGDPYAAALGIEVVDWGPGWATTRGAFTTDRTNFADGVHGGALFSLGDVALSVASNSWGRRAVATAVDIQFLTAPPVGSVVTAVARERSRTRRTAAYLIELTTEDGVLAASLQALAQRLSGWHLEGEVDWPADWTAAH